MKPIYISAHHAQGFSIGYLLGIGVMFGVALRDLKKAHKDGQRAIAYSKEVIDEAWTFLPLESKEKLDLRAQFYNISLEEGL
jgi:hypothetical protein